MATEKRRVLRMLLKAALLVSLPLTGFVWALPNNSSTMAYATVLTLISIAVGVGAELLAASTETELKDLSARFEGDSRRRAEELGMRDEKLRQFDRIAALLTEQNHSLRAKLISMQVDLQRKREGRDIIESHVELPEELVPLRRSATGTRSQ